MTRVFRRVTNFLVVAVRNAEYNNNIGHVYKKKIKIKKTLNNKMNKLFGDVDPIENICAYLPNQLKDTTSNRTVLTNTTAFIFFF